MSSLAWGTAKMCFMMPADISSPFLHGQVFGFHFPTPFTQPSPSLSCGFLKSSCRWGCHSHVHLLRQVQRVRALLQVVKNAQVAPRSVGKGNMWARLPTHPSAQSLSLHKGTTSRDIDPTSARELRKKQEMMMIISNILGLQLL